MREAGLIALGILVGWSTPAVAQLPVITKLEIVGNHAGRMMKLTIDDKIVFEGRGHLDPPGVTWTLDIQPGEAPANLVLELEPCEKPFVVAIPRSGETHALIIADCEIELVK